MLANNYAPGVVVGPAATPRAPWGARPANPNFVVPAAAELKARRALVTSSVAWMSSQFDFFTMLDQTDARTFGNADVSSANVIQNVRLLAQVRWRGAALLGRRAAHCECGVSHWKNEQLRQQLRCFIGNANICRRSASSISPRRCPGW